MENSHADRTANEMLNYLLMARSERSRRKAEFIAAKKAGKTSKPDPAKKIKNLKP